MTLPTWPIDVPDTARDGWQMPEMYLAPLATEMDGGNQRNRSQPGNNVASMNYPLAPMSLDQFRSFDVFVRTTLNNGTSSWMMNVLTGADYQLHKVQFQRGKSPVVDRVGDLVNVVLALRVYGLSGVFVLFTPLFQNVSTFFDASGGIIGGTYITTFLSMGQY